MQNPGLRRKTVVLSAMFAIIVLTYLAYSASLSNGFTNWDDDIYITGNNLIRFPCVDYPIKIFTNYHYGLYTPLTFLSYAVEYYFFKLDPMAYHTTNTMLHILNCLLVFWLIMLLSRSLKASVIAAILFGIHPMHVESVAWISERKDLLCAFFLLFSAVFYELFKESSAKKYFYISVMMFAFSLGAKPMGVVFPFVLIAFDYLKGRTVNAAALSAKWPFFVLSAIGIIAALYGRGASTELMDIPLRSFPDTIFISSYAALFYIVKLMFPFQLSCFYPFPAKVNGFLPLEYLMSPVIIIALGCLVTFTVKHTRKVIFGMLFYFLTILPVLHFVPIALSITSEHYSYVPYLGLFYLIGVGFVFLEEKAVAIKWFGPFILRVGLACIIISLTILTYNRTKVWKSSVTLMDDLIKKYPNVAEAYLNRGLAFYQEKKFELAMADYNAALALNPSYARAYDAKGQIYLEMGAFDKAVESHINAIRINSVGAKSFFLLGNVYDVKKDYAKAVKYYDMAIRLKHDYDKVFINRGIIFAKNGDLDKAIADFTEAIRLNRCSAIAYYNRSMAETQKGDEEQARKDFKAARTIVEKYGLPAI